MPAAYLTDFGLARAIDAGGSLTGTGQAVGTAAYMSPEQARGETATLTVAADVWSLGCVLYELLAGRRAFAGDVPAEVLARVLTGEPPGLDRIRPDVPGGLQRVIAACLSKPPRARYPSVRALAEDLASVIRGATPRVGRRDRARVAFAIAALALPLALLGLLVARAGDPGPVPRPGTGAAQALADRAWQARVDDPAAGTRSLTQALALEPTRDEWRVRLGLLRWATGDGDGAQREWATVTRAPFTDEARLWAALEPMFRWRDGKLRYDLARPPLRALAQDLGPHSLLVRAALACASGEFGAGRLALRRVEGWEGALLRAQLEVQAPDGDLAEALRAFDLALAEGPGFAWAYSNRGSVRARLGDAAGACADQRRALALDPAFPMAWYNLGHALEQVARPAEALDAYARATEGAPGWHAPALNRALLLQAADRPEEAERVLDAVIERGAPHPALRTARAALRIRRGDGAGAATDAEWVLARDPADHTGIHNLASARCLAGDLDRALVIADEGCARHPRSAELHAIRGNIRAARGEHALAIVDLTAALGLDPGPAAAWYGRGNVRAALGDHEGARADFGEAIARAPGDHRAHYNRGNACLALGDGTAAADAYTRALALVPEHWNSRYNRALARLRSGDVAGAEADLQASVYARPDHLGAGIALGELLLASDRPEAAVAILRVCARLPLSPDATEVVRARLADAEARLRDRVDGAR